MRIFRSVLDQAKAQEIQLAGFTGSPGPFYANDRAGVENRTSRLLYIAIRAASAAVTTGSASAGPITWQRA